MTSTRWTPSGRRRWAPSTASRRVRGRVLADLHWTTHRPGPARLHPQAWDRLTTAWPAWDWILRTPWQLLLLWTPKSKLPRCSVRPRSKEDGPDDSRYAGAGRSQ